MTNLPAKAAASIAPHLLARDDPDAAADQRSRVSWRRAASPDRSALPGRPGGLDVREGDPAVGRPTWAITGAPVGASLEARTRGAAEAGAVPRVGTLSLPDACRRVDDVSPGRAAREAIHASTSHSRCPTRPGEIGYVHETEGVYLPPVENTPERIAALFPQVSDPQGQVDYDAGGGPTMKFITKAARHLGLTLG